MSVSALKQIITSAFGKGGYKGLVEKSELIAKAKEARDILLRKIKSVDQGTVYFACDDPPCSHSLAKSSSHTYT